MKKKTARLTGIGFLALALVLGLLAGIWYGNVSNYSEAELNSAVENAVEEVKAEMYTQAEIDEKIEKAVEGLLTPEEVQAQLDEKDERIAELESELATTEAEIEVEEAGYLLDGLRINNAVPNKVISDKEIQLFDGEVEVDDEEFDAEELVRLSGLFLAANENDFKEDVFLTIPEEAIKYQFVLDSNFDRDLVTEDEPLKISLLGEDIKIINWEADKIEIEKGEEYLFVEGETKEIEGRQVEMVMIGDDYIYISVDSESKKIDEGKKAKVNGLEILASEVLSDDEVNDIATIRVGEDVLEVIETGDEFEKDSAWEWQIDPKKITLLNKEEFMYLDEDEDFHAIAPGEQVCLPNDFVCIRFDGLLEEDFESYDFDVYTKGGAGDFVRVKGSFLAGVEDYDKIYINKTGIYDADLDLIDNAEIKLGDGDMKIVLGGAFIKIENANFEKEVQLAYDLSDVWANNGVHIDGNEDNYRTDFGIIVFNPEDSCEDQKFKIDVPEEKLEASITVFGQ